MALITPVVFNGWNVKRLTITDPPKTSVKIALHKTLFKIALVFKQQKQRISSASYPDLHVLSKDSHQ